MHLRIVEKTSAQNRTLGRLRRRLSWTGWGMVGFVVFIVVGGIALFVMNEHDVKDNARIRRQDAKAFSDRISATIAKDVDEAMRLTPGCRNGCAKHQPDANHWQWETANDISALVVELIAWPEVKQRQRAESFRLIVYTFYTKPIDAPGVRDFGQPEAVTALNERFFKHANNRNLESTAVESTPVSVIWPFPGKERMRSEHIYFNILRYGPFDKPEAWRGDLPEHEAK